MFVADGHGVLDLPGHLPALRHIRGGAGDGVLLGAVPGARDIGRPALAAASTATPTRKPTAGLPVAAPATPPVTRPVISGTVLQPASSRAPPAPANAASLQRAPPRRRRFGRGPFPHRRRPGRPSPCRTPGARRSCSIVSTEKTISLQAKSGDADEPGHHQVAMLVILDRDVVRHVPVPDHTRLQRTRRLRDPVLFGAMDVAFHRLQPGGGAGGDAKADAGRGGGAFRHRIGDSGAGDTRDVRRWRLSARTGSPTRRQPDSRRTGRRKRGA